MLSMHANCKGIYGESILGWEDQKESCCSNACHRIQHVSVIADHKISRCCPLRPQFWRHQSNKYWNPKPNLHARAPGRYGSSIRIRGCTVNSLRTSFLRAMLDDDKKTEFCGKDLQKKKYLTINNVCFSGCSWFASCDDQLCVSKGVRSLISEIRAEMQLLLLMRPLEDIKFAFARWGQRGSWFNIENHFVWFRVDKILTSLLVNVR